MDFVEPAIRMKFYILHGCSPVGGGWDRLKQTRVPRVERGFVPGRYRLLSEGPLSVATRLAPCQGHANLL